MNSEALKKAIDEIGISAIAVSGGIDSLTLATVACKQQPLSEVYHAVSPAVPQAATQRVREHAEQNNWDLKIIDAGEFSDQRYRENPVNRCFYCKGNLYGKIAASTSLPILSGTNLDDLSDFRPGLSAAKEFDVRHPFVEAEIDKEGIRGLARELGLSSISELPAAPCLSSRVTTGIRILAEDLNAIERVEELAKKQLGNITFRCRLSSEGFVLEVADTVLAAMNAQDIAALKNAVKNEIGLTQKLAGIRPYKRGSAFIGGGLNDHSS